MPKKQSAKKQVNVKDLPKKDKKLSAGEMKKGRGGRGGDFIADITLPDVLIERPHKE